MRGRLRQDPLLNEGDIRGTPIGGGCIVPKRPVACVCRWDKRDPLNGWCRNCGGLLLRPLLVGELNPYGSDPRMALYPHPRGAAGDRLRGILGLRRGEYLQRFARTNLCTGKWDLAEARERARDIEVWRGPGAVLVLLGTRVCEAFGVVFSPFTLEGHLAILPHPSGRCRLWNEPGAEERARAIVAEALALGGGGYVGRRAK